MNRLFKKLKNKISVRILTSLLLLLSLTIAAILFTVVVRITNDNIKVTKGHLNMLSISIFQNLRNIMNTGDIDLIKKAENEASSINGVEKLSIVKSQSLIDLYSKDEILSDDLDILETFKSKEIKVIESDNKNGHFLRIIKPMIASSECISCHLNQKVGDVVGAIDLTFSLKDTDENLTNIITNIVITAIFLGLLTLIIIFFIVKKATEPIEGLKQGFQRLIDSDRTYKSIQLRVRSSDEIGDVVMLFNKYMDKLKKDLKQDVKNYSNYIIDSQPNIIITTDKHNTILQSVNKSFLEFFNVDSIKNFQIRYGKCICDTFFEKDGENYLKKFNNGEHWYDYVLNNQHKTHKVLIKKDQKDYIFKISIGNFQLDDEIFNIAVFTDITELENIEQKLLDLNNNLEKRVKEEISKNKEQELLLMKKEKIAALGEMMDAIAHQWKQPLTLIGLDIDELQIQIDFGETISNNDILKVNSSIHEQIDHLITTIDEFRQFFRPNQNMLPVNIKTTLEEVLGLMKSVLIKNNIEISVNCDDNIQYNLIKTEFKHIFINFITNAKDAFIENNVQNSNMNINVYQERKWLIITVLDNANGIPETVIDDVFKVNVTTKVEGKGTGIGLYLVKQIIEKLNGTIEVENIIKLNNGLEEKGSKFTIKLPLSN